MSATFKWFNKHKFCVCVCVETERERKRKSGKILTIGESSERDMRLDIQFFQLLCKFKISTIKS